MSWDLSSEEVIINKLEAQFSTIVGMTKKIKHLEEQLEHLNDINFELGENLKCAEDQNHYFVLMGQYRDKMYEAQEKLAKAEKVIDFYANPDNWHEGDQCHDNAISMDDTEPANGELAAEYRDYVAGKTAREYKK